MMLCIPRLRLLLQFYLYIHKLLLNTDLFSKICAFCSVTAAAIVCQFLCFKLLVTNKISLVFITYLSHNYLRNNQMCTSYLSNLHILGGGGEGGRQIFGSEFWTLPQSKPSKSNSLKFLPHEVDTYGVHTTHA